MAEMRPISVRLGPDALAYLDERGDDRERGQVIRAILDSYALVVRAHTPDLLVGEWALICDAMNGTLTPLDNGTGVGYGAMLYANVAAAIEQDHLDQKHEIDSYALLAKLRELDVAGVVTVYDYVRRFWTRTNESLIAHVPAPRPGRRTWTAAG